MRLTLQYLTHAAQCHSAVRPRADGLCESDGNCPVVSNSDQNDMDGNGGGDACDPDIDGKHILAQLQTSRPSSSRCRPVR